MNTEKNSRFSAEERAEIKDIVHEALTEFFTTSGKKTKNFLLAAALVMGAITVILGGFKAILAWIGFSYMGK